jgi:hypothetical protein
VPELVPPLSIGRATVLSVVVLPDSEPRFKECTSHTEFIPDGSSQQFGERLFFFGPKVLDLMEEQGSVQSQIFSDAAHLVPVVPRRRWWLDVGHRVSRSGQHGDGRWIGWRQLEPLADRAVIDAELASNCAGGRDLLVQCMGLRDADCATRQASSIAF